HTSYSKESALSEGLCLRSVKVRTCNEFEWLSDIAAEFLGVWHFNVGHLCGMVGFGLWVQYKMCSVSNETKQRSLTGAKIRKTIGVTLWTMPRKSYKVVQMIGELRTSQ